jgi:hypothetical protein
MRKPVLTAAAAASLLLAGAAAAQPGPGPGGWDLARREAWLDQRIDRGVADGSLNRVEASRIERELGRIRLEERHLRRSSGGRLRPADRDRLMMRLDNLSDHVRWARRNDVARPW